MPTYSSIAVFCGSKSGNNPVFEQDAITLGQLMGKEGCSLIYGGGNKGLMAGVANAVLAEGGTVTGIIPHVLTEWEHQHEGITELIVVENMHVRKRMLYERCDAVVVLPGGYGTLDEIFEVLTWNQLKIHQKPVYLLNSGGFYDALIQHLERMEADGFLYSSVRDSVFIIDDPAAIFAD